MSSRVKKDYKALYASLCLEKDHWKNLTVNQQATIAELEGKLNYRIGKCALLKATIAKLDRENIRLRSELGTEINYHAGSDTHYRAVRMRKALKENDL